jgi:hypothetical protein
MKLDPKKELQVLLSLEDLGEATAKEIAEYLLKESKTEFKDAELNRYLRRLKAKKVVATNVVNGETAYKIADIPFPARSDMARVKAKLTTMDPKEASQLLDTWLKNTENVPTLPITNKYRNFHRFEMTFETVDPILGDRIEDGKECGQFPKDAQGNIFIPPSWWKGWFRSNLYVLNIPEAIAKFRLGYVSLGLSTQKSELESKQAMGDKGPKNYEALPPGTKIKMAVKFPLVGTPIKSTQQFRDFISEVSEEPQRGFGANPFYYGGRMKLVEFEDKGLVASRIVS